MILLQCVNIYLYRYTNYFKDIIEQKIEYNNKNKNKNVFITDLSQYRDVSDLCKINTTDNTIVFLTGKNDWQPLVDFCASFGINKPLLQYITANLSITTIPHRDQNIKKKTFSGPSRISKIDKRD